MKPLPVLWWPGEGRSLSGGVVAVSYLFCCDGCGTTAYGVAGDYVHPAPPLGWTWRFGPGLDGPHACSDECWRKVCTAPDGRLILPDSHERAAWARATSRPPPLPPSSIDLVERPAARHAASYVYFAQRGSDGPIKIGVSKNPVSRVKELGTASAEGLRLLGVVPGTRKTEMEMHTQFSGCRLNGEWFRPSPDLMAYVAAHAKPLGAWRESQ